MSVCPGMPHHQLMPHGTCMATLRNTQSDGAQHMGCPRNLHGGHASSLSTSATQPSATTLSIIKCSIAAQATSTMSKQMHCQA
eukprot:4678169-Amphidinium_carterae.1